MATAYVVPARHCHIRPIARNMRRADRDEIAAMSGKSPGAALAYSLRKSSRAWTIMAPDGRPIGMFGVGDVNILAGVGCPWLLGTDELPRHAIVFLRNCPYWLGQLFRGYDVLRNFVDERNTLSMRWLKWLGFKFLDQVEFRGQRFRMFEMRARDV